MRNLGIAALGVALSGCAIQRAQVAQDARAQMVGMSKEQVLTCMGPPVSKATEGQTEVWAYNSGDGTTFASGSVSGGSFSGVSSDFSAGLHRLHYRRKSGAIACRTFVLDRFHGWLSHLNLSGARALGRGEGAAATVA
jgi:hypothetical protein